MLNSLIEQQKFICEKANSDFYPLDSNTMVAIALDTIGQMPIYGLRYPLVENNNIGWFIYCGEYCEDADFLSQCILHICRKYYHRFYPIWLYKRILLLS